MSNIGLLDDALFGSSTMIWDALAYRGAGRGRAPAGKTGPQFAAFASGDIDEGRKMILVIAENLIRRFGHTKTTMANISWELGTSRSNLYRYFPTKETIEEAVCDRIAVQAFAQVRKAMMRTDRASEQLSIALTDLARQTSSRMKTEPHLHRLFAQSFRNQSPVANAYLREFNGLIEGIVAHGLATREFASGRSLAIIKFVTASMLVFIHPGLSERMMFEADDLSVDLETHVNVIVESLTQGTR